MADTATPERPSDRRGISPEPVSAPVGAATEALGARVPALSPTAAPITPTVLMNSRRLESRGASVIVGMGRKTFHQRDAPSTAEAFAASPAIADQSSASPP